MIAVPAGYGGSGTATYGGSGTAAPGDLGDGVPRGFGWDGGSGTTWRTDPATGLTGILFTQRMMMSPEPPEVTGAFWSAARAALA
jgi:CubicO group peptidase (beta-lactamase class C family)